MLVDRLMFRVDRLVLADRLAFRVDRFIVGAKFEKVNSCWIPRAHCVARVRLRYQG